MATSIRFQVNPDKDYSKQWNKLMAKKCKCGHSLGAHAFAVMWYVLGDANTHALYVSQCCFCGYTKDKFKCECFELAE